MTPARVEVRGLGRVRRSCRGPACSVITWLRATGSRYDAGKDRMKYTVPDIPASSIDRQLVIESRAMLQHALASGIRVPPDLLAAVVQTPEPPAGDVRVWGQAHTQLSDMVAPATPRMLALLAASPEDRTAWRRLGNVPLVRQLMYVAIASLIGFIGLTLSPYVQDTRLGHIYTSDGLPLLVNELFYLCAAAMGASFANLFEAITQVLRARFDPLTEYFYWMRFLLGLIAGLLLATVFEVNIHAEETTDATFRLGAAGLALVGGFSANVLYRVLNRLTESVEHLLVGRIGAQTPENWRTAATQTEQRTAQDRLSLAREVVELRNQLDNSTPEAARASMDAFIDRLLGTMAGGVSGVTALAPGATDEGAATPSSEDAALAPADANAPGESDAPAPTGAPAADAGSSPAGDAGKPGTSSSS
jgi:hypothetical protein